MQGKCSFTFKLQNLCSVFYQAMRVRLTKIFFQLLLTLNAEGKIMKKKLIPFLSITSIVMLFITISASQRIDAQEPPHPIPLPLAESTAEPAPVDREKYAPARYGIPDRLGGFEVLAVVTHEHNPCSPADFMEVYLQGVDATFEEYQQGNTPANVGKAFEELRVINPSAVISIGGIIEDKDAFFRLLEESNLQRQLAVTSGHCLPIGGPVVEAEVSSQNDGE
jgi:hypothetical protein